jgi:hypothetical protein
MFGIGRPDTTVMTVPYKREEPEAFRRDEPPAANGDGRAAAG